MSSHGARHAATGAIAAAAAFVFVVFAEWAVRGNPDMLVLPGGALPGIGPTATDGSVTLHLITAAIFAAGRRWGGGEGRGGEGREGRRRGGGGGRGKEVREGGGGEVGVRRGVGGV